MPYTTMAMAAVATTSVAIANGWTYLGCYTDNVNARALKFNGNIDGGPGAVTIERCQAACLDAGWSYAGVEFGNECYCDHAIFNNGVAPDGETGCNMPCAANQTETCGGPDRLNMYQYIAAPVQTACPAPTVITITVTLPPSETTTSISTTSIATSTSVTTSGTITTTPTTTTTTSTITTTSTTTSTATTTGPLTGPTCADGSAAPPPAYMFVAESTDSNVNNYYARVRKSSGYYYIYFGSQSLASTFVLNSDQSLQASPASSTQYGTLLWERNYGSQAVDYIGLASASNLYKYTTSLCSIDINGYLQCSSRGTIFQTCPSVNGNGAAGYLQIGTQLSAGCTAANLRAINVNSC